MEFGSFGGSVEGHTDPFLHLPVQRMPLVVFVEEGLPRGPSSWARLVDFGVGETPQE